MSQSSLATTRTPRNQPRIRSESREIELKFLVTEPDFKATQQSALLGQEAQPRASQRLRTVYFDTERGDLRRHKMVLRMRARRRGYVMALKWSGMHLGGPFERGEIEINTIHAEPEPALLGEEIAATIAEITAGQALLPVYATDIRRITRRVYGAASEIEVAFDSGFIIAADRKLPVREIELELKSGDPAELYSLGISLAEAFPLRLGAQAKSERGALLGAGVAPQAVRGLPPLEGEPSVDEAVAALINACINQFIGNWPAFESGDSVTAIHQMRVAMRRLRSVLSLFQRSFPCAEFTMFRQQAKEMASAMGGVRNWDVFIDLLRTGPAAAFPGDEGFAALLLEAEGHRAACYAAVRALLALPDTTRFVLSVQAFVARCGWRNAAAEGALLRLTAPAREFAAQNLMRMHRKILKRGKNLLALSPYDRHEVRIGLKKLRYAADLSGGLFAARGEVRAFNRAAAKLQDQLGLFNDLIVAADMAARLGVSAPSANRAVGISLGWFARGALVDDDLLADKWKAFRKAKPFW